MILSRDALISARIAWVNRFRHAVFRRWLAFLEWKAGSQFTSIADRLHSVRPGDILACTVIHNEKKRLPFFLDYHRKLGVDHFLVVDHESEDGAAEYLAARRDCTSWTVRGSYRPSRAGTIWSNRVLNRYANGHWVLRLDPDEFFVYPHSDTRTVHELTEHLDRLGRQSFFSPLIDCYAATAEAGFQEGDDMFERFPYFDAYGYTRRGEVKGGFRKRCFYHDERVNYSPVLQKFALVKWTGHPRYLASTHKLSPQRLQQIPTDIHTPTGCLMHFKITADTPKKIACELRRKQTYGGGLHYVSLRENPLDTYYAEGLSTRFVDWRTLADCGLLSVGDWR